MCGLLKPQTNEGVSRLKRSTWYEWTHGEFWTGQTIWRVVGFLLFFIYVSFLHFFYFKGSTTVTTDKQRAKRIQQKNIQKCGGQVAPNSIGLGPSNKTKSFFFLFSTCFKIICTSYFSLYNWKGGTSSFSFFFFLLPKNKCLSSSSLIWIYKF